MNLLKNINASIQRGLIAVIAIVLSILGFHACDSIVGSSDESRSAEFNVYLTDAPAQYDAVIIDIQEVRIRYRANEADTAETDTTDQDDEANWITLSQPDIRLDLLKLQNGADTLLASANLEPGRYSNLRLVLGTENEVVVDGQSEQLKVPSGQQSGYKLKIDANVEAGNEYELLIDFDARQSVHKAGKSGKYILRPVLRTVSLTEAGAEPETGSINGVVQPAEADPYVFTVMNSDTISTTADTTGAFKLIGLQEGSYDVNIEPSDTTYRDTTITGINVQAGEETDMDTVQLQTAD